MLTVEEYLAKDVESLHLGRDADKLAVITDPAGYCWEMLERHDRQVAEPLCKVRSCSGIDCSGVGQRQRKEKAPVESLSMCPCSTIQ